MSSRLAGRAAIFIVFLKEVSSVNLFSISGLCFHEKSLLMVREEREGCVSVRVIR